MNESLKARLREPSTYVGIALLVELVTGRTISSELMASTTGMIISAIVGIGAFLGVVVSESKPK